MQLPYMTDSPVGASTAAWFAGKRSEGWEVVCMISPATAQTSTLWLFRRRELDPPEDAWHAPIGHIVVSETGGRWIRLDSITVAHIDHLRRANPDG